MGATTISLKPSVRKRLEVILKSGYSPYNTMTSLIEDCIIEYLPEIERKIKENGG